MLVHLHRSQMQCMQLTLRYLDIDLVIVHLRACAGGVALAVIIGIMALPEQHNLVREELVHVPRKSTTDAHSTADVPVQIVMVVIVVSVEVVLPTIGTARSELCNELLRLSSHSMRHLPSSQFPRTQSSYDGYCSRHSHHRYR